jgi:uncharacterized protein (TIGR03086 family)
MGEIAQQYRQHADAFESKVAAARPDQWSNQSPCEHWDARAVVGHIIDMHAAMLRPLGREPRPGPSLEEDPLGAFRAARADVEAVLDDSELALSETDTPAGTVTAEQHIDEVVSDDLVLHGWDLARATGQDDTMDVDDLERIWGRIMVLPAEFREKMRTPGAFGPGVEVFGPEVKVPGDAPLQHRLLGLIGRDPAWSRTGG